MCKKFFIVLIVFVLAGFVVVPCYSADDTVLKTGISMEERVPNSFMGTWRVTSRLLDNGGSGIFKLNGVDLWNLSRRGNVINLSNPFTGASASITVNYVDGKSIKFTKTGNYDNKILTDTVELRLNGESFAGTNTLKLDTISDVDNSVIRTETARYSLVGEKISGTSIVNN